MHALTAIKHHRQGMVVVCSVLILQGHQRGRFQLLLTHAREDNDSTADPSADVVEIVFGRSDAHECDTGSPEDDEAHRSLRHWANEVDSFVEPMPSARVMRIGAIQNISTLQPERCNQWPS
jgi:hypothetical protein